MDQLRPMPALRHWAACAAIGIHAAVAALIMARNLLMLAFGTLFFDNPTVSYLEFFWSWVKIPLFVAAMFWVSILLYLKKSRKIAAVDPLLSWFF